MVITKISADEVLKGCREVLNLPANADGVIDDKLLAALLRRAAGILCPCSRSTLALSVFESLQYLSNDADQLSEQIDAAVESLIISGDLLELSQVTIDDPAVKGTWVFAAPPSFVARPSGSVFLIGVVSDEVTPLPASFGSRVIHEGYTRIIAPQPSEDLPSVLRELGLIELSEGVWLKTPKKESATELYDRMVHRLMGQLSSGTVDGLTIIDPARGVDYYNGRWISPKKETGSFVARRPQAYGAPIWGFAMLADGVAIKFLDLPLKATRWRGCDDAWYLQMAIDHRRGTPQVYRRRSSPGGAYLDFFSPLPLWAQRRLAILGRPAARHKCLFSYYVPERELAAEEEFLQERLWLAQHNDD